MTPQQMCWVKECTRQGYGSEDISNMSLLTANEVRDEVAELRRIGVLADMFITNDEVVSMPMTGGDQNEAAIIACIAKVMYRPSTLLSKLDQ